MDEDDSINEPLIASAFSQMLAALNHRTRKKSVLFLSNSMPIRDFDAYDAHGFTFVKANRGASGIDGIISSAVGILQAAKRDVYLVIGDIAFLHDLNSLHLLKQVICRTFIKLGFPG